MFSPAYLNQLAETERRVLARQPAVDPLREFVPVQGATGGGVGGSGGDFTLVRVKLVGGDAGNSYDPCTFVYDIYAKEAPDALPEEYKINDAPLLPVDRTTVLGRYTAAPDATYGYAYQVPPAAVPDPPDRGGGVWALVTPFAEHLATTVCNPEARSMH